MDVQRDIYKAIKGYTKSNPQNIVGILGAVDARQKLLLTYEELCAGLKGLIEAGKIIEISPTQFCENKDASKISKVSHFAGFSFKEFEQACDEYSKMMERFMKEIENNEGEDDFGVQKIVIRWKLSGNNYATEDDEDRVEEFAEKIDEILQKDSRAEVNGFEYGPGQIDVLIFGSEKNENTDDIYLKIVNVFKAYGCPIGSSIIRNYLKNNEEVESDEII